MAITLSPETQDWLTPVGESHTVHIQRVYQEPRAEWVSWRGGLIARGGSSLNPMQCDATLGRMLGARRVAVVGASADSSKFGAILLQSLISGGYSGELFPVNPKADYINGLKCYARVSDIPGPLDLTVIIVPAPAVLGVIEESADKGAAGVFVISGGFRESGRAELEKAVVEAARTRGMRLFGPNTQGIAYAANQLSAVFWPVLTTPGPVGVVGQSGTVVAALTDWAQAEGLGVSASISLGNQADICESDVLRFLHQDDATRSIALYLEGVSNGARFVGAVRDVAAQTPVVVLKCGRSPHGREAVASHTGSLAGSDGVFTGLCRQYGVVRARDTDGLLRHRQDPGDHAAPQGEPGPHDVVVRWQLRTGCRRSLRAGPEPAGPSRGVRRVAEGSSISQSGARSPTLWTLAECPWMAFARLWNLPMPADSSTSSFSCSATRSKGPTRSPWSWPRPRRRPSARLCSEVQPSRASSAGTCSVGECRSSRLPSARSGRSGPVAGTRNAARSWRVGHETGFRERVFHDAGA